MHFGFNMITDEAREKLEELQIPHRKTQSGWEIFTHPGDIRKAEDRNLFEATIERYELDEALKHQSLKYWKNPDSGFYYYLINGGIFVMWQKTSLDHSTKPPTKYEVTILDWVEDQETWQRFFSEHIPKATDMHPI